MANLREGNDHLQPVTSHFIDLLGPKEFMQVLMSYRASLEEVSLMSAPSTAVLIKGNLDLQSQSTSGQAGQDIWGRAVMDDIVAASTSNHVAGEKAVYTSTASQQKSLERDTAALQEWITEESSQVKVGEHEQVVDALSKSMVKEIYRKMRSMDGKLEGLKQSVDSMHKSIVDLRNHALPKVQKLVEQSLNFAVENEARKIPRFVFLTMDDKQGIQRRMVTSLIKGVKHVRIELFCEHRERPHRVDGQTGLYVSIVDDGTMIKRALPYVNGFLKVLTLVAKVGAHVLAGAGCTVPDLSQLVTLAMDTPGFLDNQGFLANISTSPDQDFNGWRQWLVSVLEKKGGMNESNIASKFELKRALYKDTSKVAWLCGMHYKDQCPLPLLV